MKNSIYEKSCRGVKGDRGDRGLKGERGPVPDIILDKRGYPGEVGPIGQKGYQGRKGNLKQKSKVIIRFSAFKFKHFLNRC